MNNEEATLISRSKEPKKIVILTSARSGSNMLQSLLRLHPKVSMLGEIFRPGEFFNTLRLNDLEKPISYYNSLLDAELSKGFERAGFKLFFSHLTDASFSPLEYLYRFSNDIHPELIKVLEPIQCRMHQLDTQEQLQARFDEFWNHIQNATDIKIILLQRKNIVARYVSYWLALKTNKWVKTSPTRDALRSGLKHCQRSTRPESPSPKSPVTIDIDKYIKYLNQDKTWQEMTSRLASKENVLSIFHEDISKNPPHEMRTITEFLGISSIQNLKLTTIKQRASNIRDIVSNFDELIKCTREHGYDF